jgi:hypothetical protein
MAPNRSRTMVWRYRWMLGSWEWQVRSQKFCIYTRRLLRFFSFPPPAHINYHKNTKASSALVAKPILTDFYNIDPNSTKHTYSFLNPPLYLVVGRQSPQLPSFLASQSDYPLLDIKKPLLFNRLILLLQTSSRHVCL